MCKRVLHPVCDQQCVGVRINRKVKNRWTDRPIKGDRQFGLLIFPCGSSALPRCRARVSLKYISALRTLSQAGNTYITHTLHLCACV